MHQHHHRPDSHTIKSLFLAFIINIILSIVEIIAGIIAGSSALTADALHNTSDAFSLLIAIIAWKIGNQKASVNFSFGFQRAETIGGFVNLILLLLSGIYLLWEGIGKIISPTPIDGALIIYVSVIAMVIDGVTAKISHHDSHHNSNMKILFFHNLADMLSSFGVVVAGAFVLWLNWTFVDGLIAVLIAVYMIIQAVISFSPTIRILMNGSPSDIDIVAIKKKILNINGVKDIHHIHVWNINENCVAIDCHIVAYNCKVLKKIKQTLENDFKINHSTIQIEASCCHKECDL